ncbi:MAG: hypothetical protein NZ959_07380 [Armatimonadetes bacterium]|nr:hypothetical protein [Armatimonadota bacterium]MDW8122280.1 ArsC/Spx/MgsR family protein [Armatimonadota bacterium]
MTFQWREIVKEPPTPEELDRLLGGRPVVEITGRQSPLRQRLLEGADKPSREEALRLLSQNPNWLRRPIIVAGDQVVIGFNEAAIRDLVATRKKQ